MSSNPYEAPDADRVDKPTSARAKPREWLNALLSFVFCLIGVGAFNGGWFGVAEGRIDVHATLALVFFGIPSLMYGIKARRNHGYVLFWLIPIILLSIGFMFHWASEYYDPLD